ncbi:MAG: TIGR00266 family protein [Spirulinaceae cyanobacterium]
MDIQLLPQPERAIAKASFKAEDKAIAQAGAMVTMTGNLSVSTTLRSGRTFSQAKGWQGQATPKALFLNQFHAAAPGHLLLAPPLPGTLMVHPLTRQGLIASSLGYLASTATIELNLDAQLPHCLNDKAMTPAHQFWLTLTGQGPVLLTGLGGLYAIDVTEDYQVAPRHVVAFEASLAVTLRSTSSSRSRTWLGDDQRICYFQGQGKVYCQTHNGLVLGK